MGSCRRRRTLSLVLKAFRDPANESLFYEAKDRRDYLSVADQGEVDEMADIDFMKRDVHCATDFLRT